MSGFVGIYNLDGQPVEPSLLERLNARLAHRGPDGQGAWVQGPVGLASQLLKVTPESIQEVQPLVSAAGAVLVWDGRLDNRAELLAVLENVPGITAASPDPALVLAAYQTFGERLPERLVGDFAFGLFDPKHQRLLLARDTIGLRPLYYCRAGQTFLFASEIKALLAHPLVKTRPNDDVLAEVVLNSALRQDQNLTCFEGIFSLPPAFTAVLNAQGFVKRRYWDFDPSQQLRLKSFPEYAEAFREQFERAVRHRIRSAYPVAVSVSGGLDSSSIFCTAEALRRREPLNYAPLMGFSYFYAGHEGGPSDEQVFLREIEREYGVSIERHLSGEKGFFSGAREEVWATEAPFMRSEWEATCKYHDSIRQTGARVMLTGHWGDQMLFDQTYLVDLSRRFAWGKIWSHLKEYGRWCPDVDPKYFRRGFLLDLARHCLPARITPWLRWLRDRLHPAVSATDSLGYTQAFRSRLRPPAPNRSSFATAHAKSIYSMVRSGYHLACIEHFNKAVSVCGIEVAFPFLDRDLLTFLISIPGEMYGWNGIHKALLREGMYGTLPEAIAQRRGKADFTAIINESTERNYPQLLQYLEAGKLSVARGYVEERVMMRTLAGLSKNMRGQDCLIAWSLRDVLGLELWLQVFFNSQSLNGGMNHA